MANQSAPALATHSMSLPVLCLFLLGPLHATVSAQHGEGPWEEVLPIGRVDKTSRAYVHFEDKDKNFWESPWKAAGRVEHFVESYTYDAHTLTETFVTFETPDNHRRVEFRGPDYESGTYQFEGELLVEDNVTDDVWVFQLWHAALVKYHRDQGAGRLTYHSASDATGDARVGVKELAKDVRGKRVKINMIQWFEGEPQNNGRAFKYKTFDAAGNFYIKYGAYCGPGKKQTVKWINTRVWKKVEMHNDDTTKFPAPLK